MSILELTSHERRTLRAAAHPLKPVVLIGDNGLTEAIIKEIDRSLNAHSLIKIKVAVDDRALRESFLTSICEQLGCANVHHLGKTLIVYRPHNDLSKDPLHLAQGAKQSEPQQRSQRKAGEVYTPKKLLAEGQKLDRPYKPKKPKHKLANRDIAQDFFKRGKGPARKSTQNASRGSGNPASQRPGARRQGSALTLRAGRRRQSY